MTTTIGKGAGRPAAAGRRNKHAQRTPLPPKPGDVQAAKEVLQESGATQAAEAAEQLGKMTLAQLSSKARELGIKPLPRAKGALLDAIMTAERAAKPQRKAPQTVEERVEAYPNGDKSYEKGLRFAEAIKAHGWLTSFVSNGEGQTEATARRGDEAMHIAWVDGVFQYESATYTYADRVTKIRNVSQARQMAARPAEEAATVLNRVASNKAWKPKRQDAPRTVRLPFDPAKATDREIVDAVAGKGLKWHNRLSGRDESAIAPADPRRIEVVVQHDERVLKFCCPATGYRALRVTALLQVGRPQRGTAGQERAKGGGTTIVEVKE